MHGGVDGEEPGREGDEKKAGDEMVEHSTGRVGVKGDATVL